MRQSIDRSVPLSSSLLCSIALVHRVCQPLCWHLAWLTMAVFSCEAVAGPVMMHHLWFSFLQPFIISSLLSLLISKPLICKFFLIKLHSKIHLIYLKHVFFFATSPRLLLPLCFPLHPALSFVSSPPRFIQHVGYWDAENISNSRMWGMEDQGTEIIWDYENVLYLDSGGYIYLSKLIELYILINNI